MNEFHKEIVKRAKFNRRIKELMKSLQVVPWDNDWMIQERTESGHDIYWPQVFSSCDQAHEWLAEYLADKATESVKPKRTKYKIKASEGALKLITRLLDGALDLGDAEISEDELNEIIDISESLQMQHRYKNKITETVIEEVDDVPLPDSAKGYLKGA